MAKKAEEYGSHDKTFQIKADGVVRVTDIDPRGERVRDDSFLLAFNAHWEDIEVTLPHPDYGKEWAIVVDTAAGEVTTLSSAPGVVAAQPPIVNAQATHTVPARSLLVFQRTV